MHFVRPQLYASIVPRWLPNPPLLVLISGVAEILGGLGVLHPLTRRLAAGGLIALLVGGDCDGAHKHVSDRARSRPLPLIEQLVLTPQVIMKKKNTAIPRGAPKPGGARSPRGPIWAPRQSKAPQTHVKPRDTSQKSGQRGR